MLNKAVVFDLDDTLIDTSDRHYLVIYNYLQTFNINFFSKSEYLHIRRHYDMSNMQIMSEYFPSVAEGFKIWWALNIESEEFLKQDREIVSTSLLAKLIERRQCKLILLSLRSNLENAKKQFNTFTFSKYFSDIYFLAHSTINPKIEVLSSLKRRFPDIIFIGDTQSDAEASSHAKVDFYGVMTGFYSFSVPLHFADINQTLKNILK